MVNACIVLVEPKIAYNIGSICRSMMNFGITDLRLVKPRVDYFSNNVKKIALKSFSILDKVKKFSSLFEAVRDCGLVFGTTRRFGKHRIKQYFISPRIAAKQAISFSNLNKIAYVFGREDMGLFNNELKICNTYISIPTDSMYKSINLSHTVTICLYELQKEYQRSLSSIKKSNVQLSNGMNIVDMISRMNKVLLGIGYTTTENSEHIMKTLCKIFIRSKLSVREIKIIQGLWSRINWVINKIKN